MVVFYSWKNHTRAYANELAALGNYKIFELTERKKRSNSLGFISGCFQAITKKETQVTKMPDLANAKEIFICSPVWASGIAPAIRYFINHAPLKGVIVNFLLTCGSIDKHEDYRKAALDSLNGTGAVQGAAYVFACPMKEETDVETVRNHIKKVIIGEI